MSMSSNVIQETVQVLKKAKDLFDAAAALNITEAGLRYRISNNPNLMSLAIEHGLYSPRKEHGAQGGKVETPKPAAVKNEPVDAEAPKIEPATKPDPVVNQAGPECKPKPKNKDRKRGKPRMRNFDAVLPEEYYQRLQALADDKERPVNVQAGRMLRRALDDLAAKA